MYTDTHILVVRKMSVMGPSLIKSLSVSIFFFYKSLITEIVIYNDNVNKAIM